MMCIMLTLLCCRHKITSEMTTSEMTTSEPSQTSEKKYQTNACACGSRTARPRDQDSEQEPSKAPRAEKPQEMCRSLRYTNELSETSKASEKKHEASGCACELQDPQAHETKSAREVRAEIAKVAPTAIKAYNGKAGIYEQVVQKRGQPLREGFTIVKVRAVRLSGMS